MSDILGRVRALEDGAAVRFVDHFGRALMVGIKTPVAEIVQGAAGRDAALDGLMEKARSAGADPLPPERGVAFARQMLDQFAADPRYAPALISALDAWEDEYMGVGAILAQGFAASMLLFAANHRIEGEIFGIRIRPVDDPMSVEAALAVASADGTHFMDAIPFDWARPESGFLCERLAVVFSTASEATQVLQGAGVPKHLFAAEGVAAHVTWTQGLEVAARRGAVRVVVGDVIADPGAEGIHGVLRGLILDPPQY